MLRSLLRPAALVTHVLVVTVVVTCVVLGQWQLRRLDEVRASNAQLERQMAAERSDMADLVAAGDPDLDVLRFRPVEATGAFRPAEEVLQRNRDHQGQQGYHLLTPFVLDGTESVVLVRRGWVPAVYDTPPVAQAPPPSGTVTITGLLEQPVEQPGFGPQDPDEGRLERVFHTDTARLDVQVDGALYPMVLRLDAEADDPMALPAPIPSPELDEANHLSYAVQWHSFAVIAFVTYVLWLRGRLKRRPEDSAPIDPNIPAVPRRPTSTSAS